MKKSYTISSPHSPDRVLELLRGLSAAERSFFSSIKFSGPISAEGFKWQYCEDHPAQLEGQILPEAAHSLISFTLQSNSHSGNGKMLRRAFAYPMMGATGLFLVISVGNHPETYIFWALLLAAIFVIEKVDKFINPKYTPKMILQTITKQVDGKIVEKSALSR